jgi:hypothetical protein
MSDIVKLPINTFLGSAPFVKGNPGQTATKVNELIVAVNNILDGTTTLTGIEAGNGTVALPSVTFVSDLDSGIYRIGANEIGIGVGGAKVLDVTTTGLAVTGTLSSTGLLTAVATNPIVKPVNDTAATGAVLTGAQIIKGYVAVTGATGNLQFPTAADLTTALGTSPIGTTLELVINATAMTGTNVVTLTVNTGLTFLKQISAGDAASVALATVTQTAGVHVGVFKLVYDTATSVVVSRVI